VQNGRFRLFIPDLQTLDAVALFIAIAAFIALFRFKLSMLTTLLLSAGLGTVYYLLFL
jgi:uncharacterized membrane protein YjjB (DUF3815 family)